MTSFFFFPSFGWYEFQFAIRRISRKTSDARVRRIDIGDNDGKRSQIPSSISKNNSYRDRLLDPSLSFFGSAPSAADRMYISLPRQAPAPSR